MPGDAPRVGEAQNAVGNNPPLQREAIGLGLRRPYAVLVDSIERLWRRRSCASGGAITQKAVENIGAGIERRMGSKHRIDPLHRLAGVADAVASSHYCLIVIPQGIGKSHARRERFLVRRKESAGDTILSRKDQAVFEI